MLELRFGMLSSPLNPGITHTFPLKHYELTTLIDNRAILLPVAKDGEAGTRHKIAIPKVYMSCEFMPYILSDKVQFVSPFFLPSSLPACRG